MADIHIDDFYRDCALILLRLYTSFPRKSVLYVDDIPLTSTGKMDKKVVRADLDRQGYQLPDLRDQATSA